MSIEKRVTIRIPDDLHADIVRASGIDTRSVNGEIIYLLRLGLAAAQERRPPDAPGAR